MDRAMSAGRAPIATAAIVAISAFAVAASVPAEVSGSGPRVDRAKTDKIYVTQPDDDAVAVYRAKWKKKVKLDALGTISGFDEPLEIAVGDRAALVVNGNGKTVSKVDTGSDEIVAEIKVGRKLRSVAITPDGDFGLVAYGKKNVAVIDVEQERVVDRLKVGKNPWKIRMDHEGISAFTINVKSNDLSVIDVQAAIGARETVREDGAVVDTIKKGVCDQLSGGLDVFYTVGANIFLKWTCGDLYTGSDAPPLTFFGDRFAVEQSLTVDPEDFTWFGLPLTIQYDIGDVARLIEVYSLHTNQRQTPQFPGGTLLVMQAGANGDIETYIRGSALTHLASGGATSCCSIVDDMQLSVLQLGCPTNRLGLCDVDAKAFKPGKWGRHTSDTMLGQADSALFGRPPGR